MEGWTGQALLMPLPFHHSSRDNRSQMNSSVKHPPLLCPTLTIQSPTCLFPLTFGDARRGTRTV